MVHAHNIQTLQSFVFLVSRKVEAVEECITKMERNMDPGRLRKMFTSLPGVFSVSGYIYIYIFVYNDTHGTMYTIYLNDIALA